MRRRIDTPDMCGHPLYEGDRRCAICGRPATMAEQSRSASLAMADLGSAVGSAVKASRLLRALKITG